MRVKFMRFVISSLKKVIFSVSERLNDKSFRLRYEKTTKVPETFKKIFLYSILYIIYYVRVFRKSYVIYFFDIKFSSSRFPRIGCLSVFNRENSHVPEIRIQITEFVLKTSK